MDMYDTLNECRWIINCNRMAEFRVPDFNEFQTLKPKGFILMEENVLTLKI